jgi:hypothetical protein
MTRKTLAKAIARLGMVAVLPFLAGATDLGSNFEARVLAAHNRERAALGLEKLQWNSGLQQSAQLWADYLARSGRFEHAPERGDNPQGENLWAGTAGYFSVDQMVDAWVREKRYFRETVFPNNSTTGDIRDVGHYTQLVWRKTRKVGCAIARGKEDEILVCRYSQAGNYIGELPY